MSEGYPQCVEFLQWALPRLGMRWPGFRKVRGQVCKRVRRRCSELGLSSPTAYRAYLERHPDEWEVLEGMTHITISRFGRDRGVFALLEGEVLPALAGDARGSGVVAVWSAGCASGEEAYTLGLIWQLAVAPRFPAASIRILATDVDDAMLTRASQGCYRSGSLRELPVQRRAAAFEERDGDYCVRGEIRRLVSVVRHDLRDAPPGGPFDLVLCRNLAFTYFDDAGQRVTAARLAGALRPGGALVLGKHETLPPGVDGFESWSPQERVYRRVTAGG